MDKTTYISPEALAIWRAKLATFNLKWKEKMEGKDRAERRRLEKEMWKDKKSLYLTD